MQILGSKLITSFLPAIGVKLGRFFLIAVIVFISVVLMPHALADTGNRRTNTNFATCGGNIATDQDLDYICDSWEPATLANPNVAMTINYPTGTYGAYVYNCGPGTADLVCPRIDMKDIFVEIDCVPGYCPSLVALDKVKTAFLNMNIQLHLQVNDGDLDANHPNTTSFPGTNSAPGFDQIKRIHFGTQNERIRPGVDADRAKWDDNGWKEKQQVFHYALFTGFQTGNTGSSGIAELWGNDLMISLGSFTGGVGSVEQQAGTFMHELGHNLYLNHGGNDAINCKPNYLSVMSYTRQMGDLVPTRDVDYSRKAMGPIGPPTTPNSLSESSLDETSGIETYADVASQSDTDGNPEEQYTYGPTAPASPPWTGTGVDWNLSGGAPSGTVPADINNLSGCGSAGSTETLNGYDDWANKKFNFKDHANGADGVEASETDAASGTTFSCVGGADSFTESSECVREVSGGAINGGAVTPSTESTLTDEGHTMRLLVNGTEVTLDDVLSHRSVRYEELRSEILGGTNGSNKVKDLYNNAFDEGVSLVTTGSPDFYKIIRILNRINHTTDGAVGGNPADDLIQPLNQSKLLLGIASVKLTFEIAARFEPNNLHPAKFLDDSPRQQEFLAKTDVICHSDPVLGKRVLFRSGQDDRPACIFETNATKFKDTYWVTGPVILD